MTLDLRSATSLRPQILKLIHSSIRAQLQNHAPGAIPHHLGFLGSLAGGAILLHDSDARCLTSTSSILMGLSGPRGNSLGQRTETSQQEWSLPIRGVSSTSRRLEQTNREIERPSM